MDCIRYRVILVVHVDYIDVLLSAGRKTSSKYLEMAYFTYSDGIRMKFV